MHGKTHDVVVAGLAQDLRDATLDGALAHKQLGRNLAAALALAGKAQNRQLDIVEGRRAREDALGRLGKRAVTRQRGTHHGEQFIDTDVLVHKAVDARLACLVHKGDLGHTRHDNDAALGQPFFDARRRHDAVGIVLGAHIHQYHVRTLLERDTQGLGGIGDRGNDGHIGLVANGARQALAQDGLIFDN